MARAGLTAQQVDLSEINEAFAAQAIPCIEQLGLDPERVNVHGGAIAYGHPLGASGARMMISLMTDLEISSLQRGLATMCIGVGQGIAVLVERA
jgi:acetyl-CoA acetyltransferase